MSQSYSFEHLEPSTQTNERRLAEITSFLHRHLEQYGDKPEDIRKAIDYALSTSPDRGGFVLLLKEQDEILGTVVINRTGMSGYIPENILVYIAVNGNYRGKGLGRKIMTRAIELSDGDIALHVEPDNPAKFLYEKLGFENKYLEMRLKKQGPNARLDKQPAVQTQSGASESTQNV